MSKDKPTTNRGMPRFAFDSVSTKNFQFSRGVREMSPDELMKKVPSTDFGRSASTANFQGLGSARVPAEQQTSQNQAPSAPVTPPLQKK